MLFSNVYSICNNKINKRFRDTPSNICGIYMLQKFKNNSSISQHSMTIKDSIIVQLCLTNMLGHSQMNGIAQLCERLLLFLNFTVTICHCTLFSEQYVVYLCPPLYSQFKNIVSLLFPFISMLKSMCKKMTAFIVENIKRTL